MLLCDGHVGPRPTDREPGLLDLARWVSVPDGIVDSLWPKVRDQCAEMGIAFDKWQDSIGSLALSVDADGQYVATEGAVVMSIPRQTGKTHTVSALAFALCSMFEDFTVVWTAHRARTSDETFRSMQGMASRPGIAEYVRAIRVANGQQMIEFKRADGDETKEGSRILFGAREQGFGRGFAKLDLIVFDEAQHLSVRAIDDVVPAANASTFPAGALVFMMGTPPRPIDPSEAFTARRAEALSGDAQDGIYIEFSADSDADPDDEVQWLKANPSYPHRTKRAAMRRMRKLLANEDSFMREALGVWDARDTRTVIDMESWRQVGDSSSVAVEDMALAVDVAPDMRWASVCLAGQREDERWHVEVLDSRAGTAWVVPFVKKVLDSNPGKVRAVVVDADSPSRPLVDEFKTARVKLSTPYAKDIGTACARLFDGVHNGSIVHTEQPQLTNALAVARKRPLGNTGMWAWSRKNTESDITPVVAATLALWGAQSQDRIVRPQRKKQSDKPKVRW